MGGGGVVACLSGALVWVQRASWGLGGVLRPLYLGWKEDTGAELSIQN